MTPPDKKARSRGLRLVEEVDLPPEFDSTGIGEDWTRDLPRKKTGELKNTFAVVCAIEFHRRGPRPDPKGWSGVSRT
jgi:hypothetical protein